MKTYDELLAERDAAMREASELAMSIWRSEFRNKSPEFGLCDSPAGVISQIDNMFAGIRQQRDALAAQVALLAPLVKEAAEADESKDFLGHAWHDKYCDECVTAQRLAEIRAETGRAGFIEGANSMKLAFQYGGTYNTQDKADQYAAKVRQGEQGTWLKDSNVNGGKRQGGEK